MNDPILLAKSSNAPESPRYEETLEGHSEAVVRAFNLLFRDEEGPRRLGRYWLRFFRLRQELFDRFYRTGLAACLLHDIGKANSGFQDMVRKKGAQVMRHEHLGVLLLCAFLETSVSRALPSEIDAEIVISAVLCHHLKAARNGANLAECVGGTLADRFVVHGRQAFEIAKRLGRRYGIEIEDGKGFYSGVYPIYSDEALQLVSDVKKKFKQLKKTLKKDEERWRLLMAVRAALICADSLGSAMARENRPVDEWVAEAFDEEQLLGSEDIETKVIGPRIGTIETNSRKKFVWKDFQEKTQDLPDRALLLSGCGSGKTLAAWKWISSRLKTRKTARVIFLYPTRATAGEGFRDYVSWAPEGILLHSQAKYDLVGMFETPEDCRSSYDFSVHERLFALAYWPRRIFSATVHQFLGFLQYAYKSVCLLPLLADSVVVIDEVHSFDRALFSVLQKFLMEFDVPVLCMTATLPEPRRIALVEDCGLQPYPTDPQAFQDLAAQTGAPRYRVELLEDGGFQARDIALDALDEGLRVLFVVNTVDRCQDLARSMNALCYHSRFRLNDRKERHNAVVGAFQNSGASVLAVSTQVCEMSLDLDADVLISEIAPVASMIQRMGRCNRHLKRKFGRVYIYKPESEAPYGPEDLEGALAFAEALNGKEASQQMLDELLDRFGPCAHEPRKYAAFLESGPYAESKEATIMDAADISYQAVLDTDISDFFRLRNQKEPFEGLVLPVPKYPEHLSWETRGMPRYIRTASAENYHPEYGFFKHPLETIL